MIGLSCTLSAFPAIADGNKLYGDLDNDGILTSLDLSMMRKNLVSGSNDAVSQKQSDLNGDGKFDNQDISLMQDYILGKDVKFSAGSEFTPEAPYNGQKALTGSRQFEKLDRGTVAVSTGKSAFISWRLLASDEPDIGFNVYRITDGKTVKLNDSPLTGGTNYTDTTADLSKDNKYYVTTFYNGVETETDGDYTLKGSSAANCITIPIMQGGAIHFVWTGDFNGDGNYDFLVDRVFDDHQKLEAYLNDGTYLYTIDMGYNSENKNQITPGASTIDVGMWDGATVYDLDMDGKAEVLLRVADGVTFGDGSVYKTSVTNGQAIAVIDGMTGKKEAEAPVPDDKIEIGPKACMMEVGYLDGRTPSLVCWIKNRNPDKSFNSYNCAYGYGTDGKFKLQWKAAAYGAEAHQIRIADVDYDGKDEVLHQGYCLNGDGSLRYTIKDIVHGDRWYVGSFSNKDNNKEMLGYGIQQENQSGLLEYFYNASTGKILWTNYADEGTYDVARGNVGDIDPEHNGYECWSFQGTFNQDGTKICNEYLYPVIRLWWDGDLLSESYNDGKIEKWDYKNHSASRVATTWKITDCVGSDRGAPMFYGDILGDWREEIVMTSGDYSKLVILTTTIPTDYRFNTLAQDATYRNCMTAKGYVQSHMLSYYLGTGMKETIAPDISIIGESSLVEGGVYMIKNANSGQYLEVKQGTAANGTNVQQWGADGASSRNTWKLVSDGKGFYNLVSQLGGGNTYCLDIDGNNSANNTNVQIWEKTGSKGQQFTLTKNPDGSYVIHTNTYTGGVKCVEIADASTSSGANVQQMKVNGSSCQNWIFELVK